jgi:hypothetical protein
MAKLWRALLCQRVIVDSQTNSPSYIDGIEGFAVPRMPHPFPPIVVATVWRREQENERLLMRLRVRGPAGEDVFVYHLPEYPIAATVHRFNIQFGGFNVMVAGIHEVVIEHRVGADWAPVAALPLYVDLVEAIAPAGLTSAPTLKGPPAAVTK